MLKNNTSAKIGLNSVLSSWTVDELTKMYDIAMSWDVDELRFLPYHSDNLYMHGEQYTYLLDKYIDLLEYAKEKKCLVSVHDPLFSAMLRKRGVNIPSDTCSAGRDYLSIHSNGYVFPCNFLKENLGNVYHDNFENIMRNTVDFRKELEKQLRLSCEECKLYSICQGGCAAFNRNKKDTRCIFK